MKKKIKYIEFESDKNDSINIALISLMSTDEEWKNNVMNISYNKTQKIENLLKIVKAIIKSKQKIDYVVFPELSIPQEIVLYITEKLLRIGASVLMGVEYRHTNLAEVKSEIKGNVHNEMVYFLTTKSLNSLEHLAIVQEKVKPAIQEEKELFDIGGKQMACNNDTKFIIKHNNSFFSTLICNEFLDIDLRSQLRGEIDLLFVLEWNRDTKTYDALVNASANDLHCYIAQVNNRKYGDTRLRAPYAEEYKRDIVKIKGGEYDYFVVGKVEFQSLRNFQSLHRGLNGEFKPLPTGYNISDKREVK